MGLLLNTKVEAQCGRWLPPHPQHREVWGSSVPENGICWWSRSCVGAAGRRTSSGHGGVPLWQGGSAAMAEGAGTHCPAPPSLRLHLLSQLQQVDVSHSGRYIRAFPD